MNPVGKIVKVLLAVIVSAALVYGLQGCKKDAPTPSPAQPPTTSAQGSAADEQVIDLKVTEDGFVPSPITLKKGQPVVVRVTRQTDDTCATDFILDEYNIKQKLPLNETVTIRFTPQQTGELKYGCAMDKMISGRFKIE